MTLKQLFVAFLIAGGLWHWWSREPVSVAVASPPPEVRLETPGARDAPAQRRVSNDAVFAVNGYAVRPLAEYAVTARVLSVARYRSDRESDLSPVDFALGWGRMSDPAVSGRLSISQSGRWYHWRYAGEPPIPHREIEVSSANVHLIPGSTEVARALAAVDTGQVVTLRGYLVEARSNDGWSWRSSLTREDTGGGSCEVMYVQSVERR